MNTSLSASVASAKSGEAKVSVAVRVRPLIDRELKTKEGSSGINWAVDRNIIQQCVPNSEDALPDALPFTFDHVFSMQQDTKAVYNRVVSPIVDQAFNGFNGTVLCYGQTSSGKTFTLYGSEKEEGILSLTAQHMFKRIRDDQERNYIVRLGLIEIYNEKVSDLLSDDPQPKEIPIIEVNGSIGPKHLEEIEILKPEDMLDAMRQVQKRRRVGETRLNMESSRSHTIMRILMESAPKFDGKDDNAKVTLTTALLNFVDLAGSEKVSQTGAVGDRFKEATHINKSLSTLSQVVMQLSQEKHNTSSIPVQNTSTVTPSHTKGALSSVNNAPSGTGSTLKKSKKYVNYRDSKLTRILQSSLSGNAYIAMICTVTPASIDETISSLRFARTAKNIQTQPKANHQLASGAEYERKISELQQTLDTRVNEIDDLKRKLRVFMKFSRPDPKQAQNGNFECNTQTFERRKTICSSLFPFSRQPLPLSSASTSLRSITEEGIFQVPNRFPLPKKRSSCGAIVSPFKCDEKFMSDAEAKDLLADREVTAKKLKYAKMDDASVQTEPLSFISSDTKRLRLEIEPVAPHTPPSELRFQRSHLRIASEEDRQEKKELREFHATEIEILTQRIATLDELLATSEARREELEEIVEIFKTAEMSAMLIKLKDSLHYDMRDVSTEPISLQMSDVGTDPPLRVESKDFGTDAPLHVELKDFGTDAPPHAESIDFGTDAPPHTESIDFGTDAPPHTESIDFGTDAPPHTESIDFGTDAPPHTESIDFGTDAPLHVDSKDFGTDAPPHTESIDFGTDAPLHVDSKDFGTDAPPHTESIDFGTDAPPHTESIDFGTDSPPHTESIDFGTDAPPHTESIDFGTDAPPHTESIDFGTDAPPHTESIDFGTDAPPHTESIDFGTDAPLHVDSKDFGTDAPPHTESIDFGTDAPLHVDSKDFGTDAPPHTESIDFGTDAPPHTESIDFGTDAPPHTESIDFGTDAPLQAESTDFGTDAPLHVESKDFGTDAPPHTESIDFGTDAPLHVESKDFGTDAPPHTESIDFGTDAPLHVELKDFGTDAPPHTESIDFGTDAPLQAESTDFGTDAPLHVDLKNFGTDAPLHVELTDLGTDAPQHVELKHFGTDAPLQAESTDFGTDAPLHAESTDFGTDAPLHVELKDFGTDAALQAESTDFGTDAPLHADSTDFGTDAPLHVELDDFGTDAPLHVELKDCGTDAPLQAESTDCGTDAPLQAESTDFGTDAPLHVELKDFGTDAPLQAESTDFGTDALPHTESTDFGTDALPHTESTDFGTDALPHTESKDFGTDALPHTESKDSGTDAPLHTESKDSTRLKIETRETAVQAQVIKVNRQAQTDQDTSYDAVLKRSREYRTAAQTFQIKYDNAKREYANNLLTETRRNTELQSQISLKESEKENLRHQITAIEQAHKEQKPKDSKEVQCDVMKELLEKAVEGTSGLLPVDYPRVDLLGSEINSLRLSVGSIVLESRIKAKKEEALAKERGEERVFKKPELLKQFEEKRRAGYGMRPQTELKRTLRSATKSSRDALSADPVPLQLPESLKRQRTDNQELAVKDKIEEPPVAEVPQKVSKPSSTTEDQSTDPEAWADQLEKLMATVRY